MKTPCLAPHLVAATLLAASWPAHAEAFHGGTGLTGTMASYAKSLSSHHTLQADGASSPGIARESIEEGVSHSGHIKPDRGALFMDWSLAGPLGLTGGVTFRRTRIDLRAGAHGGAPMLGAALDQELAQLRDGIVRVRFMPQTSLGIDPRF
jgi:hypothetical protein